jgi:hypothetical protein
MFELYAGKSDMGLTKIGNEIKPYKRFYTADQYTPFLLKNKL